LSWLLKLDDAGQLADELYVAVLSRPASGDEKREATEFLAARSDLREQAVCSLIWGLLASNEFCANH